MKQYWVYIGSMLNIVCSISVWAETPPAVSLNTAYELLTLHSTPEKPEGIGRVICGYQGWVGAEGDG